MAKIEATVAVSVESAIHTAVTHTAEKIAKQYGLTIESISIDWDRSNGNEPKIIGTQVTTCK